MIWTQMDIPSTIRKRKIGRENQIPSSEVLGEGRFPVIDQGKAYIAGYSNEEPRVIVNDLPLIIFGDHTRCLKYVDFPFILGADGTKVLKPREELFYGKFYYYALLNLTIPNRGYNRHYTLLKEMYIPNPTLYEQRKIAAVLDLVQQGIGQQEHLIALTFELKKNLMRKLFTEGVYGEPQKETKIGLVPEKWGIEPMKSIITNSKYGLSIKGQESGPTPILRMTNQVDGLIEPLKLQYVDVPRGLFNKYRVCRGDLLFNRTNSYDLVGRTALFDIEGDYVFASYLIRLTFNKQIVIPEYINYYFNWDATQRRLKSIATRSVSQSNISASRLKGFLVPIPPIDNQEEIVSILQLIDQKGRLHRLKKQHLDNLFQTLLHQLMTAQISVNDLDLSFLDNDLKE